MVVAEIGCNHKGELGIARDLIESAAKFAGADYVKFQKRTNKELLSPEEYAARHPNPENSYGATYGAHREFLEFDIAAHRELKACCDEIGVGYACSAWDTTAARELASLDPDYLKVPSACNLDRRLLDYLANDYGGDIHVSLGMTTSREQDGIVEVFDRAGALARLVLYACTSGYPVAHEEVCLLEIPALVRRYGDVVKAIGFSGHHLGIALDIAAQALGAAWIERHFTLDRTWKGTDHAASLEPDGFRRLVRDTRAVASAMHVKPSEILDVEYAQRVKLKRMPGKHFADA